MKQILPDTIRLHDTLYIRGNEGIELLGKVDTFYTSAWVKLMWFLGVISVIAGIAVPLALAYYQRRQAINNIKTLKDEVNAEIERAKNEVGIEVEKKLSAQLQENEKNTNKLVNSVSGKIHILQANYLYDGGDIALAFIEFLNSAIYYHQGHDNVNIDIPIIGMSKCIDLIRRDELDLEAPNYDWRYHMKKFIDNILNDNYFINVNPLIVQLKGKYNNMA